MKSRIVTLIRAVIVCAAALAPPASACVNTFETELRQAMFEGDELGIKAIMYELESAYQKDPSLETVNDLAVARLLTKRYPEAIELLREADARFPGRAIVAANLGTALELSGNDVEALRWIREGFRRDPQEHQGSEWLHVRILEAKIALAGDPEWLKTNTVLGVNFGEGDLPVMPATLPVDEKGNSRTPAQVAASISYQLNERTRFVSPPDPVVADLYAALGDLSYALGKPAKYKGALPDPSDSYEEALTYGPVQQERVQKRKQLFDTAYANDSWFPPLEADREPIVSSAPAWPWVALCIVLIVAGIGAVVVARRRLRKP